MGKSKIMINGELADFFLACQEDYENYNQAGYISALVEMLHKNPGGLMESMPTCIAIILVGQVSFIKPDQFVSWLRNNQIPTIGQLKGLLKAKPLVNQALKFVAPEQRIFFCKSVLAEFIRQHQKRFIIRPTMETSGDLYGDTFRKELCAKNSKDGDDCLGHSEENLFDRKEEVDE